MGFKTWRIFWVALVSVAVLALTGCEDDDSSPLGSGHDFGDNDPNRVSAIGDSITASGWLPQLSSMIGKEVINRGVGGATSGDGRRSVNTVLSGDKPGFLIIQYGAVAMRHGLIPSFIL